MNATSARSFGPMHLPRPEDGMAVTQKSQSNVLAQKSWQAGPVLSVAAEGFRDWFAPAFARWLQANFRNPEQVAAVFGVRYQTALNWWTGAHRASGDTVALVFLTYPQAVAWFLSEWEDRT